MIVHTPSGHHFQKPMSSPSKNAPRNWAFPKYDEFSRLIVPAFSVVPKTPSLAHGCFVVNTLNSLDELIIKLDDPDLHTTFRGAPDIFSRLWILFSHQSV